MFSPLENLLKIFIDKRENKQKNIPMWNLYDIIGIEHIIWYYSNGLANLHAIDRTEFLKFKVKDFF